MEEDFFEDEVKPSKIHRAVIAGASAALKQKAKDWRKRDDDVLQDITERVDDIVGEID
jgi:hypothetical protein